MALQLGQAAHAVEKPVQVDVARTRDAGADVPAGAIGRTLMDRLGRLDRRVGGQAADQEADSSVELVNLIDGLLGDVAYVRKHLESPVRGVISIEDVDTSPG